MEELKKEFAELNEELAKTNCTNREEKLNRMREILKQRCEDQNFTAEGDIASMERQELIELNGMLNRAQGQQKRKETNDVARNDQIDKNKNSKDKPYPNN
jgi:hypothetical protein